MILIVIKGFLFHGRLLVMLLALTLSMNLKGYAMDSDPKQAWQYILSKFVSENGEVDYSGILKEQSKLEEYLNYLSSSPVSEADPEEEQIAYWINVYNAFTIKLILDHYPLESIKDVKGAIQIPFVNSPWDIKFFSIGDEEMDLNHVEHKILRKKFDEPRIHFAIVCASISCPPLRNEPYIADQLNAQLDEQARIFINDPSKNNIKKNKIMISKIFNWFKGDFTKETTLIEYLNKFSDVTIDSKADISHMKYNWGLNDRSGKEI